MATTSNFYRVLIEVVSVRNPHTPEGRYSTLPSLRFMWLVLRTLLNNSHAERTNMVAKSRLQSLLIDDEAFEPEHAVYHGVRHNMRNNHEVMLHTACVRLGLEIDLHDDPL